MVDYEKLVKKYGTPFYLFDIDELTVIQKTNTSESANKIKFSGLNKVVINDDYILNDSEDEYAFYRLILDIIKAIKNKDKIFKPSSQLCCQSLAMT